MKPLLRWLGLVLLALAALQLFFVLRIAAMAVIDPQSTAFQRSEVWALRHDLRWRQEWVPYGRISDHLKRAVIASEDDGFVNHDGVDWNAIERAWERNAKAEEQAAAKARAPKIRGGSTITQQLAKNLLLSGERTFVRKGQEFVLTLALEQLLPKQRIMEIYRAPLLRQERQPAQRERGRAAGGDAARAQALRESAGLGLPRGAHAHHPGPHGTGGTSLNGHP
jgi:monofunctional biosynthetic peptidoglycan transglycosylase